jgi:hypothetical protein
MGELVGAIVDDSLNRGLFLRRRIVEGRTTIMTISNLVPADTRGEKGANNVSVFLVSTDTFASWPQFQESLALHYCCLKEF